MAMFQFSESNIITFILWTLYFIGLFLFFFWITVLVSSEHKSRKNNTTVLLKDKDLPKVSVIIPCYNEEKTIEKTLKALFNLDYPKNKLEIICVNDGSTDNSGQILNKFRDKVKIITQKNQGKHVAINKGIDLCKNVYFLCLDADSYPEKFALKHLISEMINSEYSAISPIMEVNSPDTFIRKIQWIEYILGVFFKYLASHVDSIMVISGPFSIYKTDVIRKVGKFRPGYMTEDFEIALRLQKFGYKIGHSLKAKVKTSSPINLKSLINQRIRWNRGNILCARDYFKIFFFKKEFSDFGLFVFPSMFLGGFFLVFSFLLIIYLFIKSLINFFYNFYLVNFDFMLYITNYSFEFSFLDLNLKALFLGIFTLILLGMMFIISLNELDFKKEIGFGKFIAFIFYVFFYRFIMVYIWLIVFKRIIFKSKLTWLR